MKHYLIIIFFVVTSCPVLTQSEEWVRHVAGEKGVRILSIDKNSTNNIYATGMYIEDACIDDDEQNYYCISDDNSALNTSDKGFVVALSPTGQRLWTVFLPCYFSSDWFYFDIAIDKNDHIYVATVFSDTSEVILPDGNTFEVQSSGNRDAYIMKLDTLGNLLWFKQFNGGFTNIKMTLNNEGNVIIGGTSFPVDLNPDGNGFMTNGGLYVAEYDDDGDFIWGYNINGQFQFKDITSDINNNILLTGEFRDTVNFNPYGTPQVYTTGVSRDAFILKINSQGNFEWVNRTIQLKRNDILQPSMYPQVESNSLTTDSIGNIYCVGSIYDTAVFNPDDSTFYYGTFSTTNGYALKLNHEGKYTWIYKIEIEDFTTGFEAALVYSISMIKNDLLVSGIYSGKMQLNESTISKEPEYVGNFNSFILKIDENKTFKWFKEYKGKTENSYMIYCAKIINLDNSYIVTTGDLISQNDDSSYEFFFKNKDSSQIVPWESDSFSLFSSFDGFIHKFQDPDYEEEVIPEPEFNLNVYPNPTNDVVKIHFGEFIENFSIKIFDLNGKIVYDELFTEEIVNTNIDLRHLSSGVYIIKIHVYNKLYKVKLIKQN